MDFMYPSLWGHFHHLAVGSGSDDVFPVEKHYFNISSLYSQCQSKYSSQEMKLPNKTGEERR